MIVKAKSLIMLTKNSIMRISLVRELWQSNETFSSFFLLKIVKIELKMTSQIFLVYSCPSYLQNFNILYLLLHLLD